MTVGNLGGTTQGQGLWPQDFISDSNTISFNLSQVSGGVTATFEGYVVCSIAGLFWEEGWFGDGDLSFDLGVADAATVDAGQPAAPAPAWVRAKYPSAKMFKQNSTCSAATTPPDLDWNELIQSSGIRVPYSLGIGLVFYVNHNPISAPLELIEVVAEVEGVDLPIPIRIRGANHQRYSLGIQLCQLEQGVSAHLARWILVLKRR